MGVPRTTHRNVPLGAAAASRMVGKPKERRAHDGSRNIIVSGYDVDVIHRLGTGGNWRIEMHCY